MAWFKKSLEDLEKAIEEERWDDAHEILKQHGRDYKRESPQMEHEISDISSRITWFGDDMDQAMHMLKEVTGGRNYKDELLAKVKSARITMPTDAKPRRSSGKSSKSILLVI